MGETVLNDLLEASGWSSEQFLAISIMAFVVLALMVVVFRMLRLFRMAGRKSPYEPNLRPLRRRRLIYPEPDEDDAAEKEQ